MLLVFSNPATNQQVLTSLLQTCNGKTGKKKKTTHKQKVAIKHGHLSAWASVTINRCTTESVWNMYACTSLSSHASGAWHARQRQGEKKGGSVSRERAKDRGMSEGSGAAIDLFHSCERCACNANSLHPSLLRRSSGSVERKGVLTRAPNAANSHFSSRRRRAAKDFFLKMRLIWAACTQRHRLMRGFSR